MNGTTQTEVVKRLRTLVRAIEMRPLAFEPVRSKLKGKKLPTCYICDAYVSEALRKSGIDNYCGCRGWD